MKHFVSAKLLIISILVTYGVYGIMLLYTIPEVMFYAHGMKILDFLPWYDISYARALFEALGTEGRVVYLTHQLPLDFLYPGLFIISSVLLISYFSQRLKIHHYSKWMIIFPIIAGISDYGENIFFTYFSITGQVNEFAVTLARVFSLVKTLGVICSVSLFIFLISWLIFEKGKKYFY